MDDSNYRRRRWTYSFRAWIDERGGNVDREHERFCEAPVRTLGLARERSCAHVRLWDLNWKKNSFNILRITRRRVPFHLSVWIGKRYRGFAIG